MKLTYVYKLSILILCLSGCSTYQTMPLPEKPVFAKKPTDIVVKAPLFPTGHEEYHVIDPHRGFNMTDMAMLAVVNNPDLKLARDDVGIASAQSFAAGLLPDPQINFTRMFPLNAGDQKGFDAGINYDLRALISYSTQKQAAAAAEQQVHLTLLWQEWQVISQARVLFTQIISAQKQLRLLTESQKLLELSYQRLQQAVQTHDESLDNVSTQLLALQSVNQQMNTLQQQLSQNQHALNQLLGLAPDTVLTLNPQFTLQPQKPSKIQEALQQLASHRPDLLALKAGYQSQDLKYRQAILEQFPAIGIGFNRSTDTTNTKTYNFGINFNLPIFNANRGNVAIEKATRQKLYDDYQQRLNAAYSDIHRLLDLQKIMMAQYQQSQKQLVTLEKTAYSAKRAYQQGDMGLVTYSTIQQNFTNAQYESIALEQSLTEQRIALQTLLGTWVN